MRLLLVLLGLIPAVALGLDLYFKERAKTRDARLVIMTNRLVAEAAEPAWTATEIDPRKIAQAAPGIWSVGGQVTLEDGAKRKRVAYHAEIAQRCSDVLDEACWRPRRLRLGEETVMAAGAAPLTAAAPDPAPSGQSVVSLASREEDDGRGPEQGAYADPATRAPAAGPDPAALAQPVEMSVEESLVWLIQDRLGRLGYSEPSLLPTGLLDASTTAAIQDYQGDHGLARNGQPSFALLDHLDATVAQRGPVATAWQVDDPEEPVGEPPREQGSAEDPQIGELEEAAPAPAAGPAASVAAPVQAPAIQPADPAGETQSNPPADQATSAAPKVERILPPAEQAASTAPEVEGPSWETAPQAAERADLPVGLEERTAPAAGKDRHIGRPVPHGAGPVLIPPGQVAARSAEPAGAPAEVVSPARPESEQPARSPAAEAAGPPTQPAEAAPEAEDDSLVFLIQDRLNRLASNRSAPIALDGKLGRQTRAAILEYQRRNKLAEDGQASEALLRHLEETLLSGQTSANASGLEQ